MNHSRNSVRKLTMLALLTAMSIVFARVLSISTGFVRFNLGSLPTLLAAVLFGPVEGFAVGAVADMIGVTLSGYAINPLITLVVVLALLAVVTAYLVDGSFNPFLYFRF